MSLAFVGAIIGCSYDWTIGSESATDPSGSLPSTDSPPASSDGGRSDASTPRDAGADVDAAPPRPNDECGPSCTCTGRDKCNFSCTTGRCELTCRDRSDCTLACGPNARCDVVCEDDATCNMDCSAGGAQCTYVCEDDAKCRGTCRASICFLDCARDCNVQCTGGALCTKL